MEVCTSLQTDNHASTPPFSFFASRMPFLPPNQQRQSTEGKSNLDFTEARDSGWQWHQLGYIQVCTSLQTDNHTSTPSLSFITGRMPFKPPNQQRQGTEGN